MLLKITVDVEKQQNIINWIVIVFSLLFTNQSRIVQPNPFAWNRMQEISYTGENEILN